MSALYRGTIHFARFQPASIPEIGFAAGPEIWGECLRMKRKMFTIFTWRAISARFFERLFSTINFHWIFISLTAMEELTEKINRTTRRVIAKRRLNIALGKNCFSKETFKLTYLRSFYAILYRNRMLNIKVSYSLGKNSSPLGNHAPS